MLVDILFFFQAEDGIRDTSVTGVQTCALPISHAPAPRRGQGPFPGVVLVHGSGPEDQDETIGPNKPFKDLAWGLASRGIAVLRYTKRTAQYGAKMRLDSTFTVEEETLADARAALALAAAQPEVDRGR